ncbi:hypothetical protein BJF78_29540 [Pseudonocardia sp. CNS-139]|nr:hypothetical protein BJF78_29540 [Pseudonocardia sp. CNS-139]
MRATCGTVSPRNASGPTAAVAAPHRSVTATAPRNRVRPRLSPSALPVSSPRAAVLSARASPSAIRAPTSRNGPTWASTDSSRPASEPTIQCRNRSNVAGSSSSRIPDSEPSTATTAAPASTMRSGDATRPDAPMR